MIPFQSSLARNRSVVIVLITAIIYFIMARGSLLLAFQQSNASPVWPPSGFAFAMILLLGRRIAPGIALGAFAGNLIVFLSNKTCGPVTAVLLSSVIAIGNTCEALAGHYLLRKFTAGADLKEVFSQPSGIFRFMLAVILMCFVSACIGSTAILVSGIITPDIYRTVWLTWWTGDFSGVLLVTPLLVIWMALNNVENRIHASRWYFVEALVIFCATIFMTSVIFLDWSPHRFLYTRAFILIPFYLLAVVRLNLREMITIITVSSIMAIWGTAQGKGPLTTFSLNESLLTVQLFVSIIMGTKLMLWTIIFQMKRSEGLLEKSRNELEQRVKERTAALRESEEHFRKAFYASPAGMAILDLISGRIVDINEAFQRMLGYERNEIIGKEPAESGIYAQPARALEQIREVREKGFIKNQAFEFTRKGGEIGSGMFSAETIHINGMPSMVLTVIDVTELKRAEQNFRRMVELAPDATVIFDKLGTIKLFNSQAEEIFGYSREETVGKPAEMLIPEGFRERHAASIGRYLASPRIRTMDEGLEVHCRRKDGTLFPVEISLSPLDTSDGTWISTSIRDISTRKRAEEKLKEVNFVLTEAQRIARIGNWEWDIVSNKLSWSDEMYRIFGVLPEHFELTFDNFVNAIHPDERKSFHDKIEYQLKHPQPFSNYYRIVRPDGSVRILERRGEVFVNSNGAPVKMAGTTQDVTERREIEDKLKIKGEELIELNYSLHQSNRELERMNAELSTFAYVASHDLQEPLRKIQTFASRILDSESQSMSPAGLDYLHRLHKSIRRLHVLLEDLLAYSRLNTAEKIFEPTDLDSVLQEEEEEFKDQLQERKVQIVRDRLPKVQAIPFQVRQLFHNLISNSLKFMADGRNPLITIRSHMEEGSNVPDMGLSSDRRYHHISFADNGIGFDPQYNQRIFEVFQRLHGHNKYPGTGIGLAICKRVVENHEGIIRAEGKPDEGATFHIFLPATE